MNKNRMLVLLGAVLTVISAFAPYQLIAGEYYSMFQHRVWAFVVVPAAIVILLTLLRKNAILLCVSILTGVIQVALLYITIHDWPGYLRRGLSVGLGWGAWAAIAGTILIIAGSAVLQITNQREEKHET